MAIRTRESSKFCDTHGGRSSGRNLQFGSSPTHRFKPMIGHTVPAGAAIQSQDFSVAFADLIRFGDRARRAVPL